MSCGLNNTENLRQTSETSEILTERNRRSTIEVPLRLQGRWHKGLGALATGVTALTSVNGRLQNTHHRIG